MVSTLGKLSDECIFEINISLKNLDVVLSKEFFHLKHVTSGVILLQAKVGLVKPS